MNKRYSFIAITCVLLALFCFYNPQIMGNIKLSVINQGICIGYNLLSDIDKQPVLLDMNGNLIHTWDNITFSAIMMPNGTAIGPNKLRQEYIYGREYCEMIEQNWDGNIVWNFSNWEEEFNELKIARQHHDFIREGNPVGYYAPGQNFKFNGKTLILSHSNEEINNISNKEIIDDVIYEVDYKGKLTGFEWHTIDHFYEFGFNLGEKIGIFLFPGTHLLLSLPNLRNWAFIKNDWFHLNSISRLGKNRWFDEGDKRFNPQNLMICSRHTNIIAIIDYLSGDIVWSMGPHYSKNTAEGDNIGQIIGPHHAHLIPKGLPGAGNLLIFDNGGIAGYGIFGMPNKFRFFSRIIEIDPITMEIIWEYYHRKGSNLMTSGENHKFFSLFLGSAQRLPNGNTLITEGMSKRVFEVNKDKKIVWDFVFSGIIYRCYRIPPEWVPDNPANYSYWDK